MPKPSDRAVPSWLADARFWVTVFIVAFWPVVWLFHIPGLVVLLVLTIGGQVLASRRVRGRATARS
jgi:hypothetical protein